MEYLKSRGKTLGIFFVLYSIAFLILIMTLRFTMPFLLALVFACILKYPTEILIKKLKLKSWSASLIMSAVFYLIIIVLVALLIVLIVSDFMDLSGTLKGLFSMHNMHINKEVYELQALLLKLHINIDPKIFNSFQSNVFSTLQYVFKTFFHSGSSIIAEVVALISYLPDLALGIVCNVVSTYFFTAYLVKERNDDDEKDILNNLPNTQKTKFLEILGHIKKTLINYILSYTLIIALSMLFSCIGFFTLGINDALLLGFIAGLLDLVPIVGMSLLYFPLAIMHFLSGDNFTGIAVIVLYAIVCLLRQIIEPKVMSNSLEMHPVVSLACFFIGLQIYGIEGVIYCFFLIVSYNILKKVNIL